ncbi:ABC transporter ATP-binding protein [Halosimplex sp. J119]
MADRQSVSEETSVEEPRPSDENAMDGDSHERTDADGDEAASELVGEDLAIGYPTTSEPVVECETVVIPRGEVTALVGPNGSGKSTLLKSMADQLAPERGQTLLDGDQIQSLDSKQLARRLGLLSQENVSPGSMTVEDLVYHGRYPHRGFFDSVSDEDRAAVDRAIDLAGVDHLRDQEMNNLSGGQKQLAWIAMVLAQDTDVLLLDEPTTFLDLHHQLRVMDVVKTLNREHNITIGVVLHDLSQAARFADNLIAMRDGKLYDWGPPTEVVTEQLLADVFQVDATVDAGESGPEITPKAAIDDSG